MYAFYYNDDLHRFVNEQERHYDIVIIVIIIIYGQTILQWSLVKILYKYIQLVYLYEYYYYEIIYIDMKMVYC